MKAAAFLCLLATLTPQLRADDKVAGGHPDTSKWTPLFGDLAEAEFVGLQGKHAGAPIWFRNVRIKELP